MIHHVSIPAREPRHVAEVLAELMGGECHPFGPLEGAFMATSGDTHGTMIEVYPERATLDIPSNDDQVLFGENEAPPDNWPFHVLLSVPLEPDEIERIGAREGWRAKTFGRGMQGQKPFFHVIEFWVENHHFAVALKRAPAVNTLRTVLQSLPAGALLATPSYFGGRGSRYPGV